MENDIIKFLLGEGSFDGLNFGDEHPFEKGKFWWRKHLRQYITQNQQAETNTVLVTSGNDLNQLIFALAYTLDAIDVRATDPRRYEAKEKAAKILEKLSSRVYQNEAQDKAGE